MEPGSTASLRAVEGGVPGAPRHAPIGDDRTFLFSALPAATYLLQVAGGEHLLHLAAGESRRIRVLLVHREVLEVNAAPDAAVGGDVITRQTLRTGAAAGRTVQSMVEALPGVVHDAASRAGGDRAPAIGAGLPHEAISLVDGVDVSFPRSGGRLRLFLPRSAVHEVRLLDDGLAAEYGRGVAGVMQLDVRRGTEALQGTAEAVMQSEGWRAPVRALQIPRDSTVQVRHDVALGGPLLADRAWFFASSAATSTNRTDLLANAPVDTSFEVRSLLLKTSFALGASGSHQLDVLAVDAPVERLFVRSGSGDDLTACRCDDEERLFSLHWAAQPSAAWSFESKAALRRERTTRLPSARRQELALDPLASPDDPGGNRALYFDRASGLRYNGLAITGGEGWQSLPREQINVLATWLLRQSEWRFGADHQQTEFRALSNRGREYQGEGFERALAGGFRRPQFLRVYDTGAPDCCTSAGRYQSLHAQRLRSWSRGSLRLGLRADVQEIRNDLGQRALRSRDIAPRLAGALDLRGDGRVVLRAHLGRTVQAVPLELAIREFSRLPNGTNQFTEFSWNRATHRYDRFRRRGVPAAGAQIAALDPYFRDEVGLTVAWRPGGSWRLRSQLVSWRAKDLYWSTDQFDSTGRVIRDVRNWQEGYRRARWFTQQVDGVLAGGVAVRADLTWSRSHGNMFSLDDDALFEGLGGLVGATGLVNDSAALHAGRSPFEREWSSNVTFSRGTRLGRSTLLAATGLRLRSGARWGRTASVDLLHPTSGAVIRSSRFLEPRDARQLEDLAWIDLALRLELPEIGRRRAAKPLIGLEVSNLTDEQEVIGVSSNSGLPLPGIRGLQAPREVRLVVGVHF